ncbi:hypothetical protein NBRC116493_27160 [Aurantivibrio infirmus]
MKTLKLYSTLGCHLCEHAKTIVLPIAEENNFELIEIDIADSEELMAKYQYTIPVLENVDSGATLNWPFDGEGVLGVI